MGIKGPKAERSDAWVRFVDEQRLAVLTALLQQNFMQRQMDLQASADASLVPAIDRQFPQSAFDGAPAKENPGAMAGASKYPVV